MSEDRVACVAIRSGLGPENTSIAISGDQAVISLARNDRDSITVRLTDASSLKVAFADGSVRTIAWDAEGKLAVQS